MLHSRDDGRARRPSVISDFYSMPIPLVAVGAAALFLVNVALLRSSPVFYEIYIRIVYSKYKRTIRDQDRNPYIRQRMIQNAPIQRFDETHDWENDEDDDQADKSGKDEGEKSIFRHIFHITDILRDILGNPLRR
jgi:hypothetical protein